MIYSLNIIDLTIHQRIEYYHSFPTVRYFNVVFRYTTTYSDSEKYSNTLRNFMYIYIEF